MKQWVNGEDVSADDLNGNFNTLASIIGFVTAGADGAVTFDGSTTVLGLAPSLNTYTLNRDIYCTTIVINASVIVKTNGYRIFFSILTNNGTIRNNGGDGGASPGSGQGGVAGLGGPGGTLAAGLNGAPGGPPNGVGGTGESLTSLTGVSGAAGGHGNGAAGLGGTATLEIATFAPKYIGDTIALNSTTSIPGTILNILQGATSGFSLSGSAASGGGGGGGSFNFPYTNGGGGAGGNGGIVYLQGLTIVNNGAIESKGGNGGQPSWDGYNGAPGGGGGGQGGLVVMIAKTITGNDPVVT